jgi:hypothetical protein
MRFSPSTDPAPFYHLGDLNAALRPPSGHGHNGGMEDQPPETVTASEIAEFVFCPEAWRLAQTGAPSANQPIREAGTAYHSGQAAAERVAGGAIAIGRILVAVALLALAVLWAMS